MDTVLKRVISFAGVAPGPSAAVAHGLMMKGTAVIPDSIQLSAPGFTATATSTTITVTNNGDAAASCDAYCEYWHTIERVTRFDPIRAMNDVTVVNPYVSSPGARGSAYMPDPYVVVDGIWNVVGRVAVSANTTIGTRKLGNQGADVASAADVVLGNDGNAFEITGAVHIDHISNVGWVDGSMITLLFSGAPDVHHGIATVGTNVRIMLTGAADFNATAGDTLTLILCTVGASQDWVEVDRAVI